MLGLKLNHVSKRGHLSQHNPQHHKVVQHDKDKHRILRNEQKTRKPFWFLHPHTRPVVPNVVAQTKGLHGGESIVNTLKSLWLVMLYG